MKKVRFESPSRDIFRRMDDSECHSPRPYVERQAPTQPPDIYEYKRVVYSSDPVHRFDYSNSSPYPLAKKTVIPSTCETRPEFLPSNDLNLSMLDIHVPKNSCKPSFKSVNNTAEPSNITSLQPNVLSSVENTAPPPNVLRKDDSFFIRRNNLDKYFNMNPEQIQSSNVRLDKENDPLLRKAELARTVSHNLPVLLEKSCTQQTAAEKSYPQQPVFQNPFTNTDCKCHHCIRPRIIPQCIEQPQQLPYKSIMPTKPALINTMQSCCHQPHMINCFQCETYVQRVQKTCQCSQNQLVTPQNAVDKKTWAIETLEKNKKTECMEVEKQSNITKEKREPTISDLLKIIKLQNEQLQLLQEKVDKFICTSNSQNQAPVQNYMTEHVALQTIDSGHKISIGVMTSFEMVRTSTVINKEIEKQNENAQIQCNRSQITIKEVVSNPPVNLNFLDGISPDKTNSPPDLAIPVSVEENDLISKNNNYQQKGNLNEDKTFNEMSLYNVQIDNATTPLMSPEQSLYLDVRDYSDSDSTSSDDQSNVGWTYYNKVMTHVNGMLQDSDMPSSASALYRNTRQQCVQMQIDKTNVSVTKRVKFGDDPLGIYQPHLHGGSDTSLKMNQLAAKYLRAAPPPPPRVPHHAPRNATVDMSFATRNYMERHKILQGGPVTSRSPPVGDLPRFLDITALKQQPKLL